MPAKLASPHRSTFAILAILLLLACQRAPLMPSPTTSPPTPLSRPPAADVEPTPSPRPFGGLPIQDPFPAATTTLANGQALLWSPWPMEGRDPQRSGRGPAVGAAQPRLAWSASIDEPAFGQPVFAADRSIYLGTVTGKLLSLTSDGQLAWSFSASGPIPTPAIRPDGTVYARAGDGTLFALQPDGRRRWTTDIGAPPSVLGPAPLVGPDSYGYLTSYHSDLVYVVQPGGFFQGAYNAHARTLGGAAVGADGLIYFGAADGRFRALDRDLRERWVFEAGAPVVSSPALGPDGSVYFLTGVFSDTAGAVPSASASPLPASTGSGLPAGGLVALDHDGRELWSTPACWDVAGPVLWPAVAADGRVQVANCAVGPGGQVRWKAPLSVPHATPAVLDADGNAYFGSGTVLVSVTADGRPRWSYTAEGEVGPPSLGPFGSVAFTSRSANRLYLLTG